MAKKSKNPQNPPQKTEENPTILTQLFADVEPTTPSISLFSSDNPFRRKPVENLPENPRKRTSEESLSLDEKTPQKTQENAKKTKKNNPSSGNGDTLKLSVGVEEKMKKKRKRDELEREYEGRKYGVVGEDEEKEKVEVGKKRKGVDSVEEMVVSEEGYDDESKLLRTVFVGNLPLKVKKKVLVKEFGQFGEVESVRIRSVPTLDGKKPKKVQIYNGKINEAADSVHAYIVFKTEASAEASLAHNMSVVGGNHIRVDRACPPRKKLKGDTASATLYSNKRTIFVGNLPFDVKDEEIYQLFCGIKDVGSSVEAVRVIRDPATSLGKGIAYVLFKTREAANVVCKKRSLKLRDRELRISHAKSDTKPTQSTTPSKRKNPFRGDSESFPVKKYSESSPVKKFSAGARPPHRCYKVNTNGDTSYQGLRASKSGEKESKSGEKKRTPSRDSAPAAFSGTKKVGKVKQRTDKRPSVAARKAKVLAIKDGGIPKQAGNKRKMDARTPQKSNQKKKFKKSK